MAKLRIISEKPTTFCGFLCFSFLIMSIEQNICLFILLVIVKKQVAQSCPVFWGSFGISKKKLEMATD